MKTPFTREKEYREHLDKEDYIAEWARNVLESIVPEFSVNGCVGEVFEGANNILHINYYLGQNDYQEWVPVECLWSEDWESINKAAKKEEKRKWKEREGKRKAEETIDIEKEERKLLDELMAKYPEQHEELHKYDCCPEDE